jgi:hypothetical protein
MQELPAGQVTLTTLEVLNGNRQFEQLKQLRASTLCEIRT